MTCPIPAFFACCFWRVLTAVFAAPAGRAPRPCAGRKSTSSMPCRPLVFARLGLTHSTRNGHTRDGKRGVPDPDFPPGLTDVVPVDAEQVLLARGTTGGLDLFRSRVAAADVQLPPLHLKAELTRSGDAEGTPPLTAGDGQRAGRRSPPRQSGRRRAARVYQIKTHANADGSRGSPAASACPCRRLRLRRRMQSRVCRCVCAGARLDRPDQPQSQAGRDSCF